MKKLKNLLLIAITLLLIVLVMKKCHPCEMLCLKRTDLTANSLWATNDIVVIMPNDWNWASGELDKNIFYIIKVSDLSAEEAKAKYMQAKVDVDKVVANRQYKVDITKVAIVSGQATETKATIESKLINKVVAEALPE